VSGLYFYDDAAARQLEPFASTRPASELRAGALLVRERWERVTGLKASGFIGAEHLREFEEPGAPPFLGGDAVIPAGSVVVNSRFVISLAEDATNFDLLMNSMAGCAVRLAREMPVKDLHDGATDLGSLQTSYGGRKAGGSWVHDVWDYIAALPEQLTEDIAVLCKGVPKKATPKGAITGAGGVYAAKSVEIGAYVVFDTTAGPILIQEGASIYPFTRLIGPVFVGKDSHVMGDRIQGSSIGDTCKVRGELSNSIVLGHSNKGHEGFVGHSYLGRWVNLGALTTTSNIKNTYGTAKLWTTAGLRDSGQQFLGTMFGDHVKTGIGMMLSTGTVLGAGANIYGSHAPPKAVAPFSWGDGEPYDLYALDRFLVMAERVMQRRHVELSSKMRSQISAAHARRWKV
jgi:UDP-N-acetylglucosamine diphosphorylase/glucosamine-1-phosphate N-acetyltransferase